MNPKSPLERPNYVLYYKAECRDDWSHNDYRFHAQDDNRAHRIASLYIEERNHRDREEIDTGKKSGQDWCQFIPLKLEKLTYVVKEVEERTSVSLRRDAVSRTGSGETVELSELI